MPQKFLHPKINALGYTTLHNRFHAPCTQSISSPTLKTVNLERLRTVFPAAQLPSCRLAKLQGQRAFHGLHHRINEPTYRINTTTTGRSRQRGRRREQATTMQSLVKCVWTRIWECCRWNGPPPLRGNTGWRIYEWGWAGRGKSCWFRIRKLSTWSSYTETHKDTYIIER